MTHHGTIVLSALLLGVSPAVGVDFDHDIVPILRARCTECHAGDKKKGGFSINTRADVMAGGEDGMAVVAGRSGESALIKRITSSDPDEQMPPKGARLSATDVQQLSEWIDADLPWTAGFVFTRSSYEAPLKPRRPGLPDAIAGRENPIDRLLDAQLAASGRPTPAPLGDAAFYRRVHLDLVGLLPEPDRLEAFLADASSDKRARAVRELLDDAQGYAEHWLTFWNDLLRNDYAGTGYIDGGRKQISGWLYGALLENKPYDAFVRELVAPGPESEGFAKGIKWRGTVSAGQSVPVQFAQSVGQAFLGINLKCASCHDSFIDRWKLDDAYGLAAVYAPEPLALFRCDVPSGRTATAAWLFPELGQIDAARPPAERLQQLAALMTHPENGRLTRTVVNRLWHRLMGRGIVHPVDAMQTEPWNADLLDFLAVDLADHRYDLKATLALICGSQAYQSVAEIIESDDHSPYRYAGPRAKRLTAEEFADALWQITGTAPKKFDAPVARPGPAGGGTEAARAGRMVRASLLKSDPLMRALGRPNREQIVSTRPIDLTTLEAMDLNNGALLTGRLEEGAAALVGRPWPSSEALVRWLFAFAYSRPPSPAELALATESLAPQPTPAAVQDLLWAVIMQPEFQLIR